MNRLDTFIAVSLIGFASVAQAGAPGRAHRGDSYQDWARVTHVQAQHERINIPRLQCTDDRYYRPRDDYRDDDRSVGGAIIGGLAGGVIGNQIGKGSGKAAATAVGAVVGAIVGDRIDNDGQGTARAAAHGRPGQRCYTVDHWETRLTGYDVTYEYNGRRYTRFMTHEPGRRVRVQVSVSPV